MTSSNTAKLMREAMEKHHISVADLAHKIGFTRSYASLVIHGKRQPSGKFTVMVERLLQMPSLEVHNKPIVAAVEGSRAQESVPPEYLAMSLEELENLFQEYASTFSRQHKPHKLVAISVMKNLLEALRVKTSLHHS